jgi:hypothetical protein
MMMLDRFHTLPDGLRVRLRLVRLSDRSGIRALLERTGMGEPLRPAHRVRFDPRRTAVVCATALIDGRETIVGIGAIDFARGSGRGLEPLPRDLVVDPRAPGVAELLGDVLTDRAHGRSRRRAA